MPKLERSDLSKLTENDIKAILFLIHACAWLPDNKAICDAIGNLKHSCEYELEKRRTEITWKLIKVCRWCGRIKHEGKDWEICQNPIALCLNPGDPASLDWTECEPCQERQRKPKTLL